MAPPKQVSAALRVVLICFCLTLSSAHRGMLSVDDHLQPNSISANGEGGGGGGGRGGCGPSGSACCGGEGAGTYPICGGPACGCPCPSYCPPPGFGCYYADADASPAAVKYEAPAADSPGSGSPKGSEATPPTRPPSSLNHVVP